MKRNAKVYVAARNEQKATAVVEDLQKETGKTALFLKLELSDLGSVYEAAEEFKGCAALFLLAGQTTPFSTRSVAKKNAWISYTTTRRSRCLYTQSVPF